MSAGSGILPTPETLSIVDELRKNNSRFAYGLFKVSGNTVIPDTQGPLNKYKTGTDQDYATGYKNSVWPDIVRALEEAGGPRFAVVDFAFISGEGRIVRTLVSIGWCPDKGVTAKEKMTFASTKTAFEAKINIGKKYAANDSSDLEYDTVHAFVSAGK
jgi:hypothetical protein